MVGAMMLLAGGILGAGVALLFAPQSGERTRRDITRYTKKVRRKAEDAVDEFSATVTDMVENLGDRAEDILDKGKDMAYEAKKDLLKTIDDAQAGLEKQKARLAKLIG
jgi:gas vesicle protein